MDMFEPIDYEEPKKEPQFRTFKCPKCSRLMEPMVSFNYYCHGCEKRYPTKELHKSLAIYKEDE